MEKGTKKLRRKFFRTWYGKLTMYSILFPIWLSFQLLGYSMYFIAKPIKAIAFMLTLNYHSAMEEITDWRMNLNMKDVFR
jgi:hypothetical protein